MMAVLYAVAVLFLVLWVAGLLIHAVFAVVGPLIHVLLIIAVVMFVVGLIKGRSAVS